MFRSNLLFKNCNVDRLALSINSGSVVLHPYTFSSKGTIFCRKNSNEAFGPTLMRKEKDVFNSFETLQNSILIFRKLVLKRNADISVRN